MQYNFARQEEGAFIEAWAIIRMFTVYRSLRIHEARMIQSTKLTCISGFVLDFVCLDVCIHVLLAEEVDIFRMFDIEVFTCGGNNKLKSVADLDYVMCL